MESLWYDLRFALRAIRRRPGFALTAVVSLTIAIAATTAVFSFVNAALLKDVPGVSRPERLVEISRSVGGEATDVTFQVYRLLREQRDLLSDLTAFALAPASVSAGGEPSVRGSLAVTTSYFDLLGVTPIRGRLFTTGEADYPNIAPVVLLSHDVWQRELGAAEDVIGRTVRVNGGAVQVVGVLPPNFAGHHTGLLVDVFLPLGLALPGCRILVALRHAMDRRSSCLGVYVRASRDRWHSESCPRSLIVPRATRVRQQREIPMRCASTRGGRCPASSALPSRRFSRYCLASLRWLSLWHA